MTAPAAEPMEVRPIPDSPYAYQVKSRSEDGWRRVDWYQKEDGTYGTDCDCPAGFHHPSKMCAHGRAALKQKLGEEFNRMTQQPKAALEVVRSGIDIEQALANIYTKVGYVQKSGRIADGPARYSYAGEADIIEALRPAMAEEGVTVRVAAIRDVVHEVITIGKFESKMQRTTLIATVRFAHGPSGTYVDCEALGEGMDSGDKSSNKAMTGALKYALRQTFCLETGNDPDSSRPENNGEEANHAPAPQRSAPRQQEVATPDDHLSAAEAWRLLPAVMRDNGVDRGRVAAVLGPFTLAGMQAYLDADPANTLGTLISAAKGGQ